MDVTCNYLLFLLVVFAIVMQYTSGGLSFTNDNM